MNKTLEGVEGSEGVDEVTKGSKGSKVRNQKVRRRVETGLLLLTLSATSSARAPPARVVSLVPALTEMVFAIGAGDRVVAVSSYDEDPPEVRTLPRVGALLDPDVERIIALRADLVLLYGSQTDLIAQLTRASIPYFAYRHGGLANVTGTVRLLGERLGRSTQGEHLADMIEQRLGALRSRTRTVEKPRVLLVFSRERGTLRNIYASGGRGFLHEMLEAAGGSNVFADVNTESVQASTELILARAPEVILELRPTDIPPPDQQAAEMRSWQALASIPAVRNQRLHFLPGRAYVVPGPRVAEGAEAMARLLHGGHDVVSTGGRDVVSTGERDVVSTGERDVVSTGGRDFSPAGK